MQTFSCDQSPGPAAVEAVQQRFGSDVVVEKSSWTSELDQTQPQPQKHGLIPEEKRNSVTLFNKPSVQENSRSFVAEFISVPVGKSLISKEDERFVGLRLHHVEKTVQDCVIRLIVFSDEAP